MPTLTKDLRGKQTFNRQRKMTTSVYNSIHTESNKTPLGLPLPWSMASYGPATSKTSRKLINRQIEKKDDFSRYHVLPAIGSYNAANDKTIATGYDKSKKDCDVIKEQRKREETCIIQEKAREIRARAHAQYLDLKTEFIDWLVFKRLVKPDQAKVAGVVLADLPPRAPKPPSGPRPRQTRRFRIKTRAAFNINAVHLQPVPECSPRGE